MDAARIQKGSAPNEHSAQLFRQHLHIACASPEACAANKNLPTSAHRFRRETPEFGGSYAVMRSSPFRLQKGLLRRSALLLPLGLDCAHEYSIAYTASSYLQHAKTSITKTTILATRVLVTITANCGARLPRKFRSSLLNSPRILGPTNRVRFLGVFFRLIFRTESSVPGEVVIISRVPTGHPPPLAQQPTRHAACLEPSLVSWGVRLLCQFLFPCAKQRCFLFCTSYPSLL